MNPASTSPSADAGRSGLMPASGTYVGSCTAARELLLVGLGATATGATVAGALVGGAGLVGWLAVAAPDVGAGACVAVGCGGAGGALLGAQAPRRPAPPSVTAPAPKRRNARRLMTNTPDVKSLSPRSGSGPIVALLWCSRRRRIIRHYDAGDHFR